MPAPQNIKVTVDLEEASVPELVAEIAAQVVALEARAAAVESSQVAAVPEVADPPPAA